MPGVRRLAMTIRTENYLRSAHQLLKMLRATADRGNMGPIP